MKQNIINMKYDTPLPNFLATYTKQNMKSYNITQHNKRKRREKHRKRRAVGYTDRGFDEKGARDSSPLDVINGDEAAKETGVESTVVALLRDRDSSSHGAHDAQRLSNILRTHFLRKPSLMARHTEKKKKKEEEEEEVSPPLLQLRFLLRCLSPDTITDSQCFKSFLLPNQDEVVVFVLCS